MPHDVVTNYFLNDPSSFAEVLALFLFSNNSTLCPEEHFLRSSETLALFQIEAPHQEQRDGSSSTTTRTAATARQCQKPSLPNQSSNDTRSFL